MTSELIDVELAEASSEFNAHCVKWGLEWEMGTDPNRGFSCDCWQFKKDDGGVVVGLASGYGKTLAQAIRNCLEDSKEMRRG